MVAHGDGLDFEAGALGNGDDKEMGRILLANHCISRYGNSTSTLKKR